MAGFSNGLFNTPDNATIPGQSYVPASYGPATANTRRNVMAMGGEGDSGLKTPTNSDVCQRYGFTIPSTGGAPIQRFRFRIRNANLLTNTTQAGAVTLGALAIGTPNSAATNQWNGDFTAAPTVVVPAPGATELGTTEYVSPWVSSSTFALSPNTFYGLTFGFTCAGVQVNNSLTPGWSWVGTGSAAAALAAAAPGTTAQPYSQYLDVRMEYEFAGTNEVGLFIGNSLTSGWLNTITGSSGQGHMGTDNTWPQQAALRLGHHAMNGGIGAAGLATGPAPFASVANLAFTRFFAPESGSTAFASLPDYAVIDNVVIDATAQVSLGTYQAAMLSLIARLRTLGIPRIYVATQSTSYTVSIFNATASAMTGRLSTALPLGAFTQIQINAPQSLAIPQQPGFGYNYGPPGTPNNWYNGSGGPYTCYVGTPESAALGPFTITAAAAAAGVLTLTASGTIVGALQQVGTPVMTGIEYVRHQMNTWIRSLPPGVQSVIDFDADITSQFYYPTCQQRPEYFDNSGDVHPKTAAMYSLMASRFANGILGN